MKLTSIVIGLAIIAGGVYVVFYTDLLKKGVEFAKGYKEATTPQEAMDSFKKAITNREFEIASNYCTGDYAEQLKRLHSEAREMGRTIDSIMEFMNNKGYNAPNSITILTKLDPFPTWFVVKGTPEVKGDKAVGTFETAGLDAAFYQADLTPMLRGWEAKHTRIFRNPLVPAQMRSPLGLRSGNVDLVKVEGAWKLDIKLSPGQADDIAYYKSYYKSFYSALHIFDRDKTNMREANKEGFGAELISTIAKSK